MYRIIDLTTGATVVDGVDQSSVEAVEAFDIEHLHGRPHHCWLSTDAVAHYREPELLVRLRDYVARHGGFLDADGNDVEGTNERGCHLGFQRVEDAAQYQIGGVVRAGGRPVPGVRVAVYDGDVEVDDLCGFAFTDDAGRYRVDFDRQDFSVRLGPLDLEGRPELSVDFAILEPRSGEFHSVRRVFLPESESTRALCDAALTEDEVLRGERAGP